MGKTRKTAVVVAAVAAPLVLVAGIGYGIYALVGHGIEAMNPMAGLRESHIEGNAPDSQDFDQFLKRDLESYFTEQAGKPVTVICEVLSDEPYQVGLSYPKYNVWVKVLDDGVSLGEGLAWVGAMEKTGFHVYQYWSVVELRKDSEDLKGSLIEADYPKIMKKLNETSEP